MSPKHSILSVANYTLFVNSKNGAQNLTYGNIHFLYLVFIVAACYDIIMATETKRLTLDISPQTHRRLKTLASYHGVTMKEFMLSRVLPEIGVSKANDETVYLLKNRKNRERLLISASRDRKDNKSFNSLKALKHALGI